MVWTQGAVASDWIYAEAVRAASQRKVVTVVEAGLDHKLIPLPFNVFHTCLATDVAAVLAGIKKLLDGERSPLSDLGRREEALAAAQEAVDIHRRLAHARPDDFLPDLASSVNNLGICFPTSGAAEALAASEDVIDIHRRLAQTRPDAFLRVLALSLTNLGLHLRSVGLRENALAASLEAVDIRRCLAQARPGAFLPDLATSLNNIGGMLASLGQRR